MPALHPLHNQLSAALQTRHNLPVNTQWLNDFLSTRGSNPPPLPALLSTAHFRILASDITLSLTPTSTDVLPADVGDVNVKERRLAGTVVVQILDVLDVGSSKWSQVEAIERVERGEEVRGREVIRTVDATGEEDGSLAGNGVRPATSALSSTADASASRKLSAGPHRLLLQDARGTRAVAFELAKIPRIGLSVAASANLPSPNPTGGGGGGNSHAQDDPGTFIGCKLLLKSGTLVRRGMVMLLPDGCVVLGGKAEAWDKKWKADRKQRLTTLARDGNDDAAAD